MTAEHVPPALYSSLTPIRQGQGGGGLNTAKFLLCTPGRLIEEQLTMLVCLSRGYIWCLGHRASLPLSYRPNALLFRRRPLIESQRKHNDATGTP